MSTSVEPTSTPTRPLIDAPIVPRDLSETPWTRLSRLTVDQYHTMASAGILNNDDRVELLEGLLVTKMSKNPPHVLAIKLLVAALTRSLPAGWHLAQEGPLVLSTDSEPEPDLAIVRGDPRDYATRNPTPDDIAMVVEVADSSLAFDRGFKLRLYARAKVPVYWIVNLNDGTVEIHTSPTGDAVEPSYQSLQTIARDGQAPLHLPGADAFHVNVREILP